MLLEKLREKRGKGGRGGGNEEKWKKEKMKRVIRAIDRNQIGDGTEARDDVFVPFTIKIFNDFWKFADSFTSLLLS